MLEAIKAKRTKKTFLQDSKPYDPKTNGLAEKGVQDSMGQLTTSKLALEADMGCRLHCRTPICQWLIELIPTIINRHQSGHDGKTPHSRIYNKHPNELVVKFGEQILCKHTPS